MKSTTGVRRDLRVKGRAAAAAALACGLTLLSYEPAGATEDPARPQVDAATYARAVSFLPFNLIGKVQNARVVPQWLDDGKRFWYRRDTGTGQETVLIDSATGRRLPLPPGESFDQSKPAPGDAGKLRSPDGRHAVFARDFNLWIESLPDGGQRQLTSDGEAHFAYGKIPDGGYQTIPLRRSGAAYAPEGVQWSPDSRTLIVRRLDERALGDYPLLESAPLSGSARPRVHNLRIALPGDRNQPRSRHSIIDIGSGEQRSFEVPGGEEFSVFGDGWSGNAQHYYFFGTNGRRRAALFDVDVATAAVRTVLTESNDTFIMLNNTSYSGPNVRLLPKTNEFIWFSERDGWGHLYLHDLKNGALKSRITRGSWLVRDIIHVDERRRLVYFTAGGREAGRNPYYRHLYRAGFDGRGLKLLTPEDAEHEIIQPMGGPLARILGDKSVANISPDGRYFVDIWSTVQQPPVSVLRSTDGKLIATLEKADASALYAMGWQPPEPFVAKADDGVTDLYGLFYRPTRDFEPNRKYPVIEHFYGGPQTTHTPRTFMQAVMDRQYVAAEKELGFITVIMDVRGTTQRSKAFQDSFYSHFADWMVDDHVAVLKQLGARYPFMDMERIGVEGHSFGGYGSARALLARPDIYKVAVSSAGSQNFHGMYPMELYFGVPRYSDGSAVNPTGTEIPVNYRDADNASLASRLQGKLMLVYGDLDENAYPAVTLQLADALIKANKSFDLVYLPNRTHDFARGDFYFIRRKWDYFVEHLQGAEPPRDYLIQAPPVEKWRSALQ